MSGGHFDYIGPRLQEYLETIGEDEDVRRRFPQLAQVFIELGPIISTIEHDIDWDLSGERAIENDADFERQSLGQLLEAVLRAARAS